MLSTIAEAGREESVSSEYVCSLLDCWLSAILAADCKNNNTQIPSSPEEAQDKTLDWLYSLPSSSSSSSAPRGKTARNPGEGEDLDGGVRGGGDAAAGEESKEGGGSTYTIHGTSSLTSSYEGGLVTSGVNTPEKVCWVTLEVARGSIE